jgi:hypothetical protein
MENPRINLPTMEQLNAAYIAFLRQRFGVCETAAIAGWCRQTVSKFCDTWNIPGPLPRPEPLQREFEFTQFLDEQIKRLNGGAEPRRW